MGMKKRPDDMHEFDIVEVDKDASLSMPICLCIENKTLLYYIPNIFFTKHIYYLYIIYTIFCENVNGDSQFNENDNNV